jgi:hypothetical protein
MTPTLRRLNDRERYWGLTWPGWATAAGAGGALYGAVNLSPFAIKPTVTIAALILAVIVVVVLGISGQALSPGRQLCAVLSHYRRPTTWTLLETPPRRGLVLSNAPDLAADAPASARPLSDAAADAGDVVAGVVA